MKVLTSDADLESLSSDSGIIKIRPTVGYVADSEAEVESVLELAGRSGVPVTPRGAGTSIPSQSVGRGSVLLQGRSMAAMLLGGSVRCEPALVKGDLNKLLELAGRWMPVDPSSYLSCTVGGMVANNSAGVRTPRYGSTIDYVEGLRAVIPGEGARNLTAVPIERALTGDRVTRTVAGLLVENWKTIIAEQPRVTKNSSGYRLERALHDGLCDLPKLLVGSEGTLGVLTEITFATRVKAGSRILLIVEVGLDELDALVSAFRSHDPTAVELVDKSVFRKMGKEDRIAKYSRTEGEYLLFCEFEGTEELLQERMEAIAGSKAGGFEPIVLTSPSEVREAWEVRNETLTLALEIREGKRSPVPGVEDLVVPTEKLGDLVGLLKDQFERRGLGYISYGHAWDANLHARPLLDPSIPSERRMLEEIMEESFEAVWKMGGSMTGEHGDGMLRAPYVARQYPKSYGVMKQIREVFDPKGVLNPGVKIV
ncbi:MAG: FAD-binding oxidoreductase [Nitrososphaerales archaeon]